jgi:hypothetical protein
MGLENSLLLCAHTGIRQLRQSVCWLAAQRAVSAQLGAASQSHDTCKVVCLCHSSDDGM